LETLVIGELFHDLEVFRIVEGLKSTGAKHEKRNTIDGIAMEQYLNPD